MEEWNKAFDQFKSIRMESIAHTSVYHSPEYKQLATERDRYFEQLCTYLEPHKLELLMNYCNSETLLQSIAESMMYEQGLKDGIAFLSSAKFK